ncbi:MAG: VOC family protein [Dehalococcoidia bacterium]|nr:VOC family protein [Chloroflexota bacterium]MCZ6865772.1 VOC family protein [Chloroflexota bacterium]
MIKGTRLQHAAFHTTDLDKARDFYGRILGLKEIVRANVMSQGIWYNVGPEHEIHITLSDSTGVPNKGRDINPRKRGVEGRHLAFAVDDLEETKKLLDAEGMPYVGSNDNLPQIFVEDPDGNLVEINSGWAEQKLAQ